MTRTLSLAAALTAAFTLTGAAHAKQPIVKQGIVNIDTTTGGVFDDGGKRQYRLRLQEGAGRREQEGQADLREGQGVPRFR